MRIFINRLHDYVIDQCLTEYKLRNNIIPSSSWQSYSSEIRIEHKILQFLSEHTPCSLHEHNILLCENISTKLNMVVLLLLAIR